MKQYYVVKSKKENDVELGAIEAASMDEVLNTVKERWQETMVAGETICIFTSKEGMNFDLYRRTIFPEKGEFSTVSKIE